MVTFTAVDLAAVVLCLASCLGIFAVRTWLRFRRLRDFPGPRLAALTGWYRGYYDVIKGAQFVAHLWELHETYGPVVRIGPNELHFNSPRAFSQIYAQGSPFPRDPGVYRAFEVEGSTFATAEPRTAKKRRDLINPFFSRRAILSLESALQPKVDKLITKIAAHGKKPVNINFAICSATVDIITSYCFAKSFDTLDAPNFRHPLIEAQHTALEYLWVRKYLPSLGFFKACLPVWVTDRVPMYKALGAVRETLAEQIDAFLADESLLESAEREIIYHHLIASPHSASADKARGCGDATRITVSRDDLVSEAITMIGAGSDTVGTSCTYGTFKALSDKRILGELTRELKEAWPDKDAPMGYTELEKLPYLTAFIKETLRVSYGVITPIPKIVRPGDVWIDGFLIPEGTSVSMGISFLHDDPEVFPNPHQFSPERWLGENARRLESFLAPFSKGPRMCPGMNLGWCEMYLILGHLFRKLDMVIYETTEEDFAVKELFTPVPSGRPFHVVATERCD